MGNTRKTTDDELFGKRRDYYLKNREKTLKRAKERYQRDRGMLLAISAKVREEVNKLQPKIEKEIVAKEPSEADGIWKRGLGVNSKKNECRRTIARKFVESYKQDKPCQDCQGVFPPFVMDFDHVSGKKIRDISTLVSRGVSEKALLTEIAKCELICANCHRIRTFTKK